MTNRMSVAEYKKLCRKLTKNKPQTKSVRPTRKKHESAEGILAMQLQALNVPFEREFRFHSTRRWRADFHIVGRQLLIEVEGGVWSEGRHTRGKGYMGDMEKYNEATALGYQIIRFETSQVTSGYAFRWIEKFLGLSQDKSL